MHQEVFIDNQMISDSFELFHVHDYVDEKKTLFHTHDYYEIHCTLKGEANFFLDGKSFSLKPGTVCLIHYSDLHRIVSQSSNYFERVYIFVTPYFLRLHSSETTNLGACFEPLGDIKSRVLHVDEHELASYLDALEQAPGKDYGADILYNFHFIEFMIWLNQMAQVKSQLGQASQKGYSPLVKQTLQYIPTHLTEDLSLDALAENFFISKYNLSREFKRQTGFTLHQYILQKRLLYSKELLRKTPNVKKIYQQCGFTSYTHFLRCFKEEFNMTPKEFIEKLNQASVVNYHHYAVKNKRL